MSTSTVNLVLVKLVPTQPCKPDVFLSTLKNLTITAYDLDVEDSLVGTEIGTAGGLTDLAGLLFNPLDGQQHTKLDNSILQEFSQDTSTPIPIPPQPYSVATAIIIVSPPLGRSKLNLRVQYQLNGALVGTTLDYGVQVIDMSLVPDQKNYFTMPASTYFSLPLQPPSTSTVQLPSDGSAPDFGTLLKAINAALDQDTSPDTSYSQHLETRSTPLTASQSQQLASVITWDRSLYPLPVPSGSLDTIYTLPLSGDSDTDAENSRNQFSSDLSNYYTTYGADATRLANFVYAVSAAITCEQLSVSANTAGLTFPVEADTSSTEADKSSTKVEADTSSTNAVFSEASLVFTYTDDLPAGEPRFTVPAAFFYALGAILPISIPASQRFSSAILSTEPQLGTIFENNIQAGILASSIAPVTVSGNPVNQYQAARRLAALGFTSNTTVDLKYLMTKDEKGNLEQPDLIGDWLSFAETSDLINTDFWAKAIKNHPGEYLNFLLQAITQGETALVDAIKTILHVKTVTKLVGITPDQWQNFFALPASNGNPAISKLLPDFTLPGTTEQRVNAFVQRLGKFFTVTGTAVLPPQVSTGGVATFGIPAGDALQLFINQYLIQIGKTVDFSVMLDDKDLEKVVLAVFPNDPRNREGLKQAVEIITNLFQVTSISQNKSPVLADFQFSLMEALYARGFTHPRVITKLTGEQFQRALMGTIAYPKTTSNQIYSLAQAISTTQSKTGPSQVGSFIPVNQANSLVSVIPRNNLAPFGLVAYLHDILAIPLGTTTLAQVIGLRRGLVANLKVSVENLETILPAIDLVNEALEAVGANVSNPGGVVYDTDVQLLVDRIGLKVEQPNILTAIPQYSSPEPFTNPNVYNALKNCFTSSYLPYSQAIDIATSNLSVLGTERFDVLRHFRKDITEFAIDASLGPSDFQSHLWRYPVRFELALSYVNITTEEYWSLFASDVPDNELLGSVLGFDWDFSSEFSVSVRNFLQFTGINKNDLLQLSKTRFVPLELASKDPLGSTSTVHLNVPNSELSLTLRKLFLFIRLWRCLSRSVISSVSWNTLALICEALHFFNKAVNPDFPRQLAALLMLQNHFKLSLVTRHPDMPWANRSTRTGGSLLSLWALPAMQSVERDHAIDFFLHRIQDYSKSCHACKDRPTGFQKALKDNLRALSLLAGFTDEDPWYAKPTCTIRFAEILAKIYASNLSVGETIFLFVPDCHLIGDDPFPLPDAGKSAIETLKYPDDDEHGIWQLREQLLSVSLGEEDIVGWTWQEMKTVIFELGGLQAKDSFDALGIHFFPAALENCGHQVNFRDRRFEVELAVADTTPSLWTIDQCSPFHYDAEDSGKLWTELPLPDEAVITLLKSSRQLNAKEIQAVQDLNFAPRALLAPFALIFENFPAAVKTLLHEHQEERRFAFFQEQFEIFHRRCKKIADHLAKHVSKATGKGSPDNKRVAWDVLRHIAADENVRIKTAGLSDPEYTWDPSLSGGAFASLLGLVGTGLPGQYEIHHKDEPSKIWREFSGDLTFFGDENNETSVPIPTVLPSLDLSIETEETNIEIVNGFAIRDQDGKSLGGAEPFRVVWTGALLIASAGEYFFHAGHPRPGDETPSFEEAKHDCWLLTLSSGQKSWTVLNYGWDASTTCEAEPEGLFLQHGVYHIEIHYKHQLPTSAGEKHRRTGFQVKYKGPDTDDVLSVVPACKLFQESKNATLGHDLTVTGSAATYLNSHYTSSLRDIRRTYQRVFKGILFCSRSTLSAKPIHKDNVGGSELQYLLQNPKSFVGTSYYRSTTPETGFKTCRAVFDLNLLPVTDPYKSPDISDDFRAHPSPELQAALFDWWERIFDYSQLRDWVRKTRNRDCWMLFFEASQQAPKPEKLLRYLSVNSSFAPQVLTYFDPSNPDSQVSVSTADLTDERWATRVWRSSNLIGDLKHRFVSEQLESTRPWLWASDDPNTQIGDASGNQNLTNFVLRSLLSKPGSTIADVKKINDRLRLRAHAALLAYLCGKDRVALPFGQATYVREPRDLNALLLMDVEVGANKKTTRIDDAIISVQTFVQRLRLGLEPEFDISSEFIQTWDAKYSTYKTWETAKRRELYEENWIQWDELQEARKSEGFRSFEQQLRRGVLSVPAPTKSLYWNGPQLAAEGDLEDLQSVEFVSLENTPLSTDTQISATTSGMSLLGQPEHDGQPSSLSSLPGDDSAVGDVEQLPLWIQAAVRLGAKFIRVTASSPPPAITESRSHKHSHAIHDSLGPSIDEYYFWLTPLQYFDEKNAEQKLGLGATPPDPACDWDPDRVNADGVKLKDLLKWQSQPVLYLSWCKVHLGQFGTPQQSIRGAAYNGSGIPALDLVGRQADSLLLNANGVAAFQYNIADDSVSNLIDDVSSGSSAVPIIPVIDTSQFPKPLSAYPYFVYFEPGAPLVPPSNFSTALSVAQTLSSQGSFEAALKWFDLAYDQPGSPLKRDNSWMSNPATSTNSGDTRTKAILLEYLDTLLQWGIQLSRKDEIESSRQALVIFNLIDDILGDRPIEVFSDDTGSGSMTIQNFSPAPLPLNPRLVALYDSVADNLTKLRNQSGVDISSHNSDLIRLSPSSPHTPHRRLPYRFTSVMSKATELAQMASSMGASLQSALEKGDAEYLSSIQAGQERQLVTRALEGKKNDFRAADWDVQSLERSLQHSLCDLNSTQTNIRNGNNSNENDYVTFTDVALGLRIAAQALMAAGQGVSVAPDVYAGGAGALGSPLQFEKITGGSSFASFFSFASEIVNSQADAMGTTAGVRLTQSTWDRRMDDWMHAVDMTTIELQSLECQKLAADRRRQNALFDVNNTQRQIDHSVETQNFMRDKTTNFDTYLFLQREATIAYRQLYNLALDAAQVAQESYHYEIRADYRNFMKDCSWDGLHSGLMAGDRLSLALQEMNRAYMEHNIREHELTKQLSLAMHFPESFLQLKLTGKCEIAIPEWIFDLDYPGHYMRRIKNVNLTIPCVVGPYTGMHCRLELLNSAIRVSNILAESASEMGGYECQSLTSDDRFAFLYGAREGIATSTGMSDSGLFQLSLQDERYLPFEFAGAVSKWKIELPPENNQFDMSTLTDVIIQLNYTSRDGGEALKRAASLNAQTRLPGDGWRLFDVRHDMSNAWAMLERSFIHEESREKHHKRMRPDLRLHLHRNMFPFLTGRRGIRVVRFEFFVQLATTPSAGSHFRTRYYAPGIKGSHEDEDEDFYHDSSEDIWFDFVAHAKWPGLYHGSLYTEIEIPLKLRSGQSDGSLLRFPEKLGEIHEFYILCQYEAVDKAP
ncbi:uncharacterized protein LY89DRAFT_455463 [Mollisia scopiformis]|uniref:Insecticidal toxin complex protein n=1 Tax=Mollisia scopiformis TaxID=149040 RepID=A0A194XL03_MOLSC|nr:uncharacterized protein LY89DRAFT_455463 [Mollisia scopiformis]KUJ20811.1 hypothetical protein LY89DRAFT_455463 [Mollisia scopiformis]